MSSLLRQQMVEHMMLRNYSDRTINSYVDAVVGLVKHYWVPPDWVSPEEISDQQIQEYLLYRKREQGISWNTNHLCMYGIRYLYKEILGREFTPYMPPGRKTRRRLPQALSREEVQALFAVTRNLKHRTVLMTLYGTGMRSSELTHLKPQHIESQRGLIRIERGKGQKDRYTLLPERLLEQLRRYYSAFRPQPWLFPGRDENKPMTLRTVESIYRRAKEKAGITRGHGPHTLRHSFATHIVEDTGDIVALKQLLGHRALSTTTQYTHVSRRHIATIKSPLDALYHEA